MQIEVQSQGSQSSLSYEYILIDLVNYNKDTKMTEAFLHYSRASTTIKQLQ